MKIAAYNIMSGGFNSYNSSAKQPERLKLLQKAIKAINADFVGLIDTFRWKEIFNVEDLKKLFGYQEAFYINMNDIRVDKRIGITVLTNLPVKKFEAINLKTRNCIKTELKFENKILNIFTVYLDDLREETRLQQTQSLLNQSPSESAILIGDFNALRPEDVKDVKTNFENFLEVNPNFKNREDYQSYFVPVLEGMSQAKVIPLIRSKGFKEALDSKKPEATFPTPVFFDVTSPFIKLDHLFYTPDLQINNFQVLTKGVFNKASDHYPIIGEISLKT